MICPRCGYEENPQNSTQCSLCRTPFSTTQSSQETGPPTERVSGLQQPGRPRVAASTPVQATQQTSRISVGNTTSRNPNSSTLMFGTPMVDEHTLQNIQLQEEVASFDPGPTEVTEIPEEFLQEIRAEQAAQAASKNPTPAFGSEAVATTPSAAPVPLQKNETKASTPVSSAGTGASTEPAAVPVPSRPKLPKPAVAVNRESGGRSPLPRPKQRLPRPQVKGNFVFSRQLKLPGLIRRFLGGVVDLSMVFGLSVVVTLLFGPAAKKVWPLGLQGFEWFAFLFEHRSPQLLFFTITFLGVLFLYQILFHALFSRTPGKFLFGMKVLDMQGRPISWLGSIARSFAFVLFSGALLMGLSWILIDRQFRGLHDRASGSIVVRA